MTLIQKLTIALLVGNVLTLIIAAYLLFFPARLPIVYNEPFPVYPTELHKGEVLTYTMDIDKRKAYSVRVNKNIVCNDGNLVTLASMITNIPLGRNVITPEVIIPQKTSYGICHIEISSEYKVNPLRLETQHMRTQDFNVIP